MYCFLFFYVIVYKFGSDGSFWDCVLYMVIVVLIESSDGKGFSLVLVLVWEIFWFLFLVILKKWNEKNG